MSSDPAMADGLNWYRYAGNNPIMYSDPTGLMMINHNMSALNGKRSKPPSDGDSDSGEEESSSSSESNNTSESYDPATRENGDGTGSNINNVPFSGGRMLTANELWFIYEILGRDGYRAGSGVIIKSNIADQPWLGKYRQNGSALSLPTGSIRIGQNGAKRELLDDEDEAGTLIHEIFHQIQYSSIPGAFTTLVKEFNMHNPYSFGKAAYLMAHPEIQTIAQIPTLEGQAEMVGQYARLYFLLTRGSGLSNYEQRQFLHLQGIMRRSGYVNTIAGQYGVSNI